MTFVVNPWIPAYRRRELAEKGESSSKSAKGVNKEGDKGVE
jgi:hypothetical protein